MIVELYGPPGAGKTTLARALIARMHQRGLSAQLALSWRPAEGPPIHKRPVILPNKSVAIIRRLTRPVIDLIADPRSTQRGIGTALPLLRILPPKSIIWSIRLSQYLCRLSIAWNHASTSSDVVVFDQAFVQSLCTLILVGRSTNVQAITHALDSMPKPDLLVRLEASKELLGARLRERLSSQSVLERLFEFDLQTNLDSIRVICELDYWLRERGRPITRVAAIDRSSLDSCADLLTQQIKSKLAAKPERAATGSSSNCFRQRARLISR